MASGALPPGFPPVVIDGEPYWDGGLVSNTPLQYVLDGGGPRQDMCVFQLDLFSAEGPDARDPVRHRAAREGHPLLQPHAPQHRRLPRLADRAPRHPPPERQAARTTCKTSSTGKLLDVDQLRRGDHHRAPHPPPRRLLRRSPTTTSSPATRSTSTGAPAATTSTARSTSGLEKPRAPPKEGVTVLDLTQGARPRSASLNGAVT